MKEHLLALFKFTIGTAFQFTQNLRSLVVLLHDFPLKVEETKLYAEVKKWRSPSDVKKAIFTLSSSLPPVLPIR